MSDFERTAVALADATKKLEAVRNRFRHAESRCAELTDQLKEKTAQQESLEAEKTRLETRCRHLEASAADTSEQDDLLARVRDLETTLAARQDHCARLAEELHMAREEMARLSHPDSRDQSALQGQLDSKRRKLAMVRRKLREKMELVDELQDALSRGEQRMADMARQQFQDSRQPGGDQENLLDYAEATDRPLQVQSMQQEIEQLREQVKRLMKTEKKLAVARSQLVDFEKRVLDDTSTRNIMEELRERNRNLSTELAESRALVRKLRTELAERPAESDQAGS